MFNAVNIASPNAQREQLGRGMKQVLKRIRFNANAARRIRVRLKVLS
jgi:hypothetical protein